MHMVLTRIVTSLLDIKVLVAYNHVQYWPHLIYTHVHPCTLMYTHVHPCTLQYTHVTNKTERFSFKSGCAMRVVELTKEDWPTVLQ